MSKHSRVNRPYRALRLLLIVAVVLAVGYVAGRWVYDNRNDLYAGGEEFIAKTVGAEVEHIIVEGVTHLDPPALRDALAMQKGDSLVGFDSAAARKRVETLPWVRLATVERRLPSTVRVQVYEYVPLARLDDADGVWVIDKDGHRIVEDTDQAFGNLPLLSGLSAVEAAPALFAMFASRPQLSDRLVEAVRIGERRWNLGFDSGVMVQLPEDNAPHALDVLTELDSKRDVLSMAGGMIDLRLEDRIVLRKPSDD